MLREGIHNEETNGRYNTIVIEEGIQNERYEMVRIGELNLKRCHSHTRAQTHTHTHPLQNIPTSPLVSLKFFLPLLTYPDLYFASGILPLPGSGTLYSKDPPCSLEFPEIVIMKYTQKSLLYD